MNKIASWVAAWTPSCEATPPPPQDTAWDVAWAATFRPTVSTEFVGKLFGLLAKALFPETRIVKENAKLWIR